MQQEYIDLMEYVIQSIFDNTRNEPKNLTKKQLEFIYECIHDRTSKVLLKKEAILKDNATTPRQ